MSYHIIVTFNHAILGYFKNQGLTVKCDKNYIPVKKLFRDLIEDAKTDGCISVKYPTKEQQPVVENPKPKAPPKKRGKKSEVIEHDAS